MKTHSQAGQDLLVASITKNIFGGFFVEVGCSHPVELSNTYALETELGWRGLMLDSDQNAVDMCRAQRKSKVVCADATKFDFRPDLMALPTRVHYLSFDVDQFQIPALDNFLRAADETKTRFAVLTVETDFYRFGPEPREKIIQMLGARGYDIFADRVKSRGCDFETWWVDLALVKVGAVDLFRSVGLEWEEILRKGGVLWAQ